MKHIFSVYFAFTLLCALSCVAHYEYDPTFDVPVALSSPDSVALDVTSPTPVVLEWSGGGAADGSIVQYDVLFAAADGSFDAPVQTMPADLGALPRLTLTHAQLNVIARRAGISAMQSGAIRWTVTASKAGTVRRATIANTIVVARGAGIDNIPDALFLFGSGVVAAGESEARAFRRDDEGVFCIYTRLADGAIRFRSAPDAIDGFGYFAVNGQLTEGAGSIDVQATAGNSPVRITVDFNALAVTVQTVANVRCIWGATFGVIGNMAYAGDGIFRALDCEIRFIDPSRPETNPPSWLSWTEERYYFIAAIDGADRCWGRRDGVSPERPTGSEPVEFYAIGEFTWDQWEHLWKMSGSLDLKRCDITIRSNSNNVFYHEFSNVRPL